MEFACRGRAAADEDADYSCRRSPDPPLPHGAGDAMLVIRDALLLQLQKDRLRQEIIMAELAKLERSMSLCCTARHDIDTAYLEQPKPLFFTFNEKSMPQYRWPEHCSNVDEVHDLKKKDVKHGSVQLKSGKPATSTEDLFSVCSRPCCSSGKAEEENEAFGEQKLQESNEPKKVPPSLKWELTGITIPVKKPKTGITIPVKKPKTLKSWSCAICQVEAPNTAYNIQQHCEGNKHRSNVAAMESRNKAIIQKAETTVESSSCADQETSSIKWSCSTCQANGTSEVDLKEHLSGRTHQQNIEAQCQEGDSMAKNAESQEAKCHKNNVPQHSEKPPCSIYQDNCTSESELGILLLAKLQALLDAINNMATNFKSCEAKSPPNNVPQDAEQTSQSNGSTSQTGSDYQSCSSEPQSENPRKIDAINNMATNFKSCEAKSPPNNVPQDAEQTSQSNGSTSQTGSDYQSCSSEPQSENPRKIDAINNMATNFKSCEAKSPPNNVPQDAEQASQSNGSISQTGSDYQSCSSEPQSENPRKIRRRRKKRGAQQVEGQDAEPEDMKPADKIYSDGLCSKGASSEEKRASYLCEVCNLDLNSEIRLADHCNGEEHLEKQKLLNFCDVCNLQCNSRKMLAHHCTGKKHQKILNANK